MKEGWYEIEGYTLPCAAKLTRCDECGTLLLAKHQGERAEEELASIPPDERPPTAVKGGREFFCPRCLNDERHPDGTRRAATIRIAGRFPDWLESGASFDNVVRASEEDR